MPFALRLCCRRLAWRSFPGGNTQPCYNSRYSAEKIGGTESLAHAFVGAGESLANWWLDHPEESQAAMAARLMNVAWIGLSGLLQSRADPWPLAHEPGSATLAPSSTRVRRRTRKRA